MEYLSFLLFRMESFVIRNSTRH